MALTQEDIIRTVLVARTRISASAWLIVHDAQAAEDIFQNVSVKVLGGGMVFEQEAQVLSWAQVAARHEAIDWLRKRKRHAKTFDGDVLDLLEHELASHCRVSGGERVEALRQCLSGLPERSQQVLQLRYFEGHSCSQVSQALGIKLEAVYQRVSRLHHALRQCIQRRLKTFDTEKGPETA